MSLFTKVLLVSPLDDGNTWVIMREFGFSRGYENSNEYINVPKGFQTDFASVPPIFRWLVPKWGKYGNAAVIHDWLYWEQSEKYPRRIADLVLYEAMEVMNVDFIRKNLIYGAVRLGGWWAWTRNAEDKESEYNRVLRSVDIKAGAKSRRRGSIAQVGRAFTKQVKARLIRK